jgi:hypothetical protein
MPNPGKAGFDHHFIRDQRHIKRRPNLVKQQMPFQSVDRKGI